MLSIFWRNTEAVEPRAPLRSPLTCDVCVVGAGYTGLWTAYLLALEEPAATLCVIDAEYAGAGASGHNDGFVTPTVGKDLAELVRNFGITQTKAVTTTVGQSVLEIGRFCRTYDIDADYCPSGYLMAATDRAQLRRLRRDRELVRQMGGQANELDAEEARARIGSPLLLGATSVGGATINPHKLVRGLARVVAEQGTTVCDNTPALDIEKHSGRYRVRTPNASIDAGTVVVATDAYQHQFKPFQRGVVPVWSYVMVTEPLTDAQLARVAWPRREGLVEARTFLRCARLTADNRVVWAGGRVRHWLRSEMEHRHLADQGAYRRLRASFEKFFPMWRDISTSHAWGGCMGITRDLVPHFGSQDGLVYGYGYCGNGIAASHTGGKVLRDLVLGKQTEYSELPFVNRVEARLPASRWRTHIGVRLRTEAIARRDAR